MTMQDPVEQDIIKHCVHNQLPDRNLGRESIQRCATHPQGLGRRNSPPLAQVKAINGCLARTPHSPVRLRPAWCKVGELRSEGGELCGDGPPGPDATRYALRLPKTLPPELARVSVGTRKTRCWVSPAVTRALRAADTSFWGFLPKLSGPQWKATEVPL